MTDRPGWGLVRWSPIATGRIGQLHLVWCRPQALGPTSCASALLDVCLDASMLAARTDTAHRITLVLEATEVPELLTPENVQVRMEHGPPGIRPGIEHEP